MARKKEVPELVRDGEALEAVVLQRVRVQDAEGVALLHEAARASLECCGDDGDVVRLRERMRVDRQGGEAEARDDLVGAVCGFLQVQVLSAAAHPLSSRFFLAAKSFANSASFSWSEEDSFAKSRNICSAAGPATDGRSRPIRESVETESASARTRRFSKDGARRPVSKCETADG